MDAAGSLRSWDGWPRKFVAKQMILDEGRVYDRWRCPLTVPEKVLAAGGSSWTFAIIGGHRPLRPIATSSFRERELAILLVARHIDERLRNEVRCGDCFHRFIVKFV
jgi:hypothetical protein